MKLSHADGRETYYETFGDPRDRGAVLIHGLGAESSSWRNQNHWLSELGYFVVVPDMFGHGRSAALGDDGLNEWTRQIEDLLDHYKLASAVIIGVSMGGVIAMNFSVSRPHRISALIVSDSFAELSTAGEKLLGFSQAIGFRVFKLLGRKLFARGMAAAYPQAFAKSAWEYMIEHSLRADFDQLLKARKAINSISVLDALSRLQAPSLIIVGAEFGEGFVKINRKIANAIPGAEFAVLGESMDPSPLVNPREFNNRLAWFLEKHFGRGAKSSVEVSDD
jgi:3-oxoadipate enol-lactonase